MNTQSVLLNNPETLGPLGFELPPVNLSNNLEKSLAVMAGVASMAGGLAVIGDKLISPDKAQATTACPNPDAAKVPQFSGSDLGQASISGVDIQIKSRGLGDGAKYTCTSSRQQSYAFFDIQQNGDHEVPINVEFKPSVESGIIINNVFDNTTFIKLNCVKVEPNSTNCTIPNISRRVAKQVLVDFVATKEASSQAIVANILTDSSVNDVVPTNNQDSVVFDVRSPESIYGNGVPLDKNGNPIKAFKVQVLNKKTRKIPGLKNCWTTPLRIAQNYNVPSSTSPNSELVATAKYLSMPRSRNKKNIKITNVQAGKVLTIPLRGCTNKVAYFREGSVLLTDITKLNGSISKLPLQEIVAFFRLSKKGKVQKPNWSIRSNINLIPVQKST
jgi:hypothetical protein